MSNHPYQDQSPNNFQDQKFTYSSLDPSMSAEIEDYSDLYDDYLDSPNNSIVSANAQSMNSSAAVYEQSVDPSIEDNIHRLVNNNNNMNNMNNMNNANNNYYFNKNQIPPIPTPIDHFQGIYVNNNNNNNNNQNTNNNDTSQLFIKTPKFNEYNPTFQSPTTPTNNNLLKTPTSNNHHFDIVDPLSNNNNNSYNYSYNNDDTINENDQVSLEEDSNINNALYYTQMNDNQADEELDSDESDSDDDLNDEEVERLRQLKINNSNISNVSNSNTNTSNDAIIITNSKVIRKGIKDFKLGKELGEGSYSTVVLATDINTNNKYAIKILNKRHIIKEKKVKYVNIEKNTLNRLGKRNGIIGLHFTFQDSQSLYFVLDYAENGELLSLIKKFGTMNEESTKYYSIQLIDAINFMHLNGVIHRDLKPENILIDKNLKLQITDFGTAKLLDKDDKTGNYPSDTRANSFVGTAEYVSPELLINKYCGKSADIWSLGCIIYQMIAGKPPFKATNEYLTFQKIQKLQYAFTAGFPIVIRDLIKRLLILNPNDRLSINEIKRHYWFKDINWNNEDEIWEKNPPKLSAYKISAISMKPIPELELQYQNTSNKIKYVKRNKTSSDIKNSTNNIKPLKQRSISTPSTPGTPGTPNNDKNNNNNSSSPAMKNSAVIQKKKRSASSAASTALYGGNLKSKPPLPTSSRSESDNSIYQIKLDSQQQIADKIVKSRQQHSNSNINNNNNNTQQAPNTSNSSIDVIPGTNIPRPVLNTKIASRNNSNINHLSGNGSKSRNNSNINKKSNEIPNMSTLDLKFIKFIKNHDERIMKVGIVEVSIDLIHNFEKKYKGGIIESPLGYKNKDKISQINLFSNNESESIKLYDIDINKYIIGNELYDDNTNNDNENENDLSVSNKFRNFFTVKQPANANLPKLDTKFYTRTLIITTFGRAILLKENRGVKDNLNKYEITSEIDLTSNLINFVEVLNDKKIDITEGLFSIISNSISIILQVEKSEVKQWTSVLANSRIMEKDRKFKEFITSNENNGNDNVDEIAFTAATLATVKIPVNKESEVSTTTTTNNNNNVKQGAFPTTLRTNTDSNIKQVKQSPISTANSTSTSTNTSSATPPPIPSRHTKSNSNTNLHNKANTNNSSNKQSSMKKTTKKIYSNPMINAAVNKAVSMASVNAGVGITDDKKINSSNSKFLARSRFK